MALCCSDSTKTAGVVDLDQGAARNREINMALMKDEEESHHIHKLLLLGTPNSGKSIFFQQIVDLHREWDEGARVKFKSQVQRHIILQMQMLLSMVRDDFGLDLMQPLSQYQGLESVERIALQLQLGSYGIGSVDESVDETEAKSEDYQPTEEELMQAEKLVEQADLIEDLAKDAIFDGKIAEAIKVVWADQRVKDVFKCKITIGVADSCPYFFNDISKFAADDYAPSMDDINKSEQPLNGRIRKKSFEVEHDRFEIYDVSGQRTERSKWIHLFDNVRAVIFVTSLTAYAECLFEDDSVNAMEESLEIWDNICNCPYFASDLTSLVIFFNNRDLFEMMLSDDKPLTLAFPEYKGLNEYKPAYEYIMRKFEEKQELYEHRTIYCVCWIMFNGET